MTLSRRSVILAALCLAFAHAAGAAADARKKLVMLISEPEYETARTLPEFARQHLAKNYRVVTIAGSTTAENSFDQIKELDGADILLVSVRRRTPPQAQLDAIRRFIAAGKPVVGIRTASHSFALGRNQKLPDGGAEWREFDHEVIGGNYNNHHGKTVATTVTLADGAPARHPILRGVKLPFASDSSLYKNTPLRPGATALLTGTIPGHPAEPLAWTFTRADGGRTFYTSLGGPGDFAQESFTRLLANGIDWAATGR